MAQAYYLVLVFAALASGSVLRPRVACPNPNETLSGSEIVQQIREQTILNNVDPFQLSPLPDQQISFRYLFQNHNGTLTLTDGLLLGFSSLEERGDLVSSCVNGVISIALPVIVPAWTVTYNYHLDADQFKPTGFMTAVSNGLFADLKFSLDLNEGASKFESFVVTTRPATSLTFTSMGAIENSVIDPILTVYTEQLFALIVEQFQEAVRAAIEGIPVETPSSTTTSSTTPAPTTTSSTTPAPTTTSSTTPAPTTTSSTTPVPTTTSSTTPAPTTSSTTPAPTTTSSTTPAPTTTSSTTPTPTTISTTPAPTTDVKLI